VRFTISPVEGFKVTQISTTERQRAVSGNRATVYDKRFRLAVCTPSYGGRSNGVPFLRKFFVQLTILPLQGFEVTHPIFEISMTMRTRLPDAFHHLVPNYNFYQTPLKIAKYDLVGSENASWQIWLRIQFG